MLVDFPVKINFFGHLVLIHPFIEWFGIFVGMRLYSYLKRKKKSTLTSIQSLIIIFGALIGALIGSKIIGTLENPSEFLKSNNSLVYFWTSNTIVGGLAFGLLGVELSKKFIGYKESTGDLMVYPLIAAMIIGRIGCFLTGVAENTFGIPTQSILGMYLGDEFLRHPVTLYEIVFLIILGIFIAIFKQKYVFPSGFIFQIFMFSYFIFRFFLDFIKPKINILFNMSTIQLICVFVILYYLYKISNNILFIKHKI